MSILLKILPILCCAVYFLVHAQNTNSLMNISSGQGHLSQHRRFKGATKPSNNSRKRQEYQLFITDGFVHVDSKLHKHIVSIRTSRATAYFGDNHICVGSIISNNLILTAAHCVVE